MLKTLACGNGKTVLYCTVLPVLYFGNNFFTGGLWHTSITPISAQNLKSLNQHLQETYSSLLESLLSLEYYSSRALYEKGDTLRTMLPPMQSQQSQPYQ